VPSPDHRFAVLLTELFVLFVSARVLGELFRSWKQPPVVGELLAGIVVGPTVLGRLAPGAYAALFPSPNTAAPGLEGLTWVGTVFLLLVAGMETSLVTLRKHRRAAFLTSALGVIIPFACGLWLAGFVPDHHLAAPERRGLFTVFLGVALAISAVPVVAKILLELGLMGTAVGQIVLSAAVVDDLVGWLLFSVVLASLRHAAVGAAAIAERVAVVLAFAAFVLTAGSYVLRRALTRRADGPPSPGAVLTVGLGAALLCGAIAEWIGVHAVFGAFLAGVAIGSAGDLVETARRTVLEFVLYFFAPLFFATVGLRADFLAHFDPWLVLPLLAVACLAKIAGCALGARLGGLPPREALAVGLGLNARGAMEIVLALLALQAGLIRESVFTALVVVAIVTSMMAGPLLRRVLGAGSGA